VETTEIAEKIKNTNKIGRMP